MLRKVDIDQARVAAMYRTAIANQPELFSALEGLAEVGDLSDALIFRERLNHRLPTRRAAAIRGLARILKEDAIAELVPYLSAESPCVVRAVRKAIGSYVTPLRRRLCSRQRNGTKGSL
jgi:HEAT repeat protein